jgi:hypothetical protein
VAFSTSHRPNMTRNGWAYARVNKFLEKKAGKPVKQSYVQDDDLMERGGLIASNGKPSNLTREQYKLVRTPEFKAWFGDWENDPKNASKVVDENGEPLVVYHGAEIFNKSENGKFYIFRKGSYFTDTYKSAEYYAFKLAYGITDVKKEDTEVYTVFLNIRNPKTFDYDKDEAEDYFWDFDQNDKRIQKYLSEGYDGIFWEHKSKMYDTSIKEKEKHYINFAENQIKLADGTNTKFDANNTDIRFNKGGFIAPNGKQSNLTPDQYKLVRTPQFKAWFGDWENDPLKASKVVDENGEPMVVYHGSSYGGITQFNKNESNRLSSGLREYGTFFTNNKKLADFYHTKGKLKKEAIDEIDRMIYKLDFQLDSVKNNRDFDYILKEIDKLEQIKKGKVYPVFLNLRKIKEFDAKGKEEMRGWYELKVDAGYKIADNRDAMDFLKNGKFGVEKVDGVVAKNIIDAYVQGDPFLSKELISDVYLVFNENENNIKLADGTNTSFDMNNPDIRYEDGGLVAPNGKPSNLTSEQYKLVRTPQFKAWFGDWENDPKNASKVVDENGEPMIVYHGTTKDFNIFTKNTIGENDYGFFGKGFYFGNMSIAKTYSQTSDWDEINDTINPNGRVLTCFLNVRNPLVDSAKNIIQSKETINDFTLNTIKNFDGVIAIPYQRFSPNTEYVVFEPNQIKLADGTNTTFDMNNLDIRYEDGGKLGQEVVCINCGWEWNTRDSDKYDKYVCHKCGFDNALFYSNDITNKVGELSIKDNGLMDSVYPEIKEVFKENGLNLDNNYSFTDGSNKVYLPYVGMQKADEYVERVAITYYEDGFEVIGEVIVDVENGQLNILIEFPDWQVYEKFQIMKKGGKLKSAKSIMQIAKEKGVSITYAFQQLNKGMKVESEHSDDKKVQKTIALQHLDENIDYYKKLAKMESTFKKGGEIDADDPKIKNDMIHKSGKVGGLLVGKRHSEGGIKAINKSNNSPLEMEGGEVVITRNAVSDETKREFEGEMLTNREILSKINESGGGVSFAEGGDIPEHIMVKGNSYKYGGNTMKDSDIVDYCGCKHKMAEGGLNDTEPHQEYEILDEEAYKTKDAKKYGIIHHDLKPSEAFYKIYGKKYKDGGKVGTILLIDKSLPSYIDFKNNNKNINLHTSKSEYKKYLKNNYNVSFDELPNMIQMGLLLGNQKLVDNYINS